MTQWWGTLHLPAEQIIQRRRHAPIGDMHHVDAGHHLEQLARNMAAGGGARRRHVEFAGMGLGVGDEFGKRLGRNRRVHH